MKVLEAWMPYQDRLTIIPHISATSYKDSIELAAHAGSMEVDAIGCMGPCFLPPKRIHELVAINKIIADSAPNIPYYYYHLPVVSGVNLKMSTFLKEASKEIPNLAGIKFTSTDLMDMQECILLENGRFDILHGHDQILLCGLAAGATGGVGTSYNLMPNLYQKILLAFQTGDFINARKWQLRSIEFVKIMLKHGNAVESTKAMFKIAGLDLGPCRLPLRNLTKNEYQLLERDLKELDFYNDIKIC
jgi:N-acetylneuraminate lyase